MLMGRVHTERVNPDPDERLWTYDWARRTNGELTPAQKQAVRAGIRAGYRAIARGVARWPFHRGRGVSELPPVPDSRLAKTAEEAAQEQGPALAGHGYRTWVLGHSLAGTDAVALDAELLYATSLLHDSGMTQEVVGQDFTVRSGELLIEVGARAGCAESVGLEMADAAVAHATPGLDPKDNPIGFYVQAGAMADLAGLRMWDLPRGLLRRAYREHPAHGIHRQIPPLIRREATQVPDGRFAALKRTGMDKMVTVSPTRLYAR